MATYVSELEAAKKSLSEALGENVKQYWANLKLWFKQKISKEEFDLEARRLLTQDNVHSHNDFLLAILTRCQILVSAPEGAGSLPWPGGSATKPGKPKGKKKISSVRQKFDNHLKDILTSVISRRKAYRLRDGHFKYAFGSNVNPQPYLKNSVVAYNNLIECPPSSATPSAGQSLAPQPPPDDAEQQAALLLACSGDTLPASLPPVNMYDLFEALQPWSDKVPWTHIRYTGESIEGVAMNLTAELGSIQIRNGSIMITCDGLYLVSLKGFIFFRHLEKSLKLTLGKTDSKTRTDLWEQTVQDSGESVNLTTVLYLFAQDNITLWTRPNANISDLSLSLVLLSPFVCSL
ncbi:transcriptional adapter 1 isoform X2 [Rissa tridactyla]|uniref:transcriptional adapter 1 isoform X2 n=1 Tax=Rissa tridactyla TaxID=75485 RepID=UPI0023BA492B|nr:transcriptional adapter 1 isoform X2 [Rissa tridactyla]